MCAVAADLLLQGAGMWDLYVVQAECEAAHFADRPLLEASPHLDMNIPVL